MQGEVTLAKINPIREKGGAIDYEAIDTVRTMWVRFTLPNGLTVDARIEDDYLHITHPNGRLLVLGVAANALDIIPTSPLHPAPRSIGSAHVA